MGTLFEDKMRRFKGEYAHFSFNKCPVYTHDGTLLFVSCELVLNLVFAPS
jgi:hypothetical protein